MMQIRTERAGFGRLFCWGGVVLCLFLGGACVSKDVGKAPAAGPEPQARDQKAPIRPIEYRSVAVRPRAGRALVMAESENFVGSGQCAPCHEKLTDREGNDMSIVNHWRSTMMANGATDPLWQAKVASEVARNPKLATIIEDKCSTCHMPMARTQAAAQNKATTMFGQGFVNPQHKLHGLAQDGVSCALCHQVRDEALGKKEGFSGNFRIDTDQTGPDREIFGPYRDVDQQVMRSSVGFTPQYGPQMNDSGLCAACHTLYTPFVDGEGKVVGEFPEQTPYLEWQHSDFAIPEGERFDVGENPGQGQGCQECHMPHSRAGGVKIANWAPPGATEKEHFSQHHFVGGNVFMLNILQNNVADLQLSASTEALEATKQRTLKQLQTQTASLDIVDLKRRGGRLTATVRVANNSGHKFPTGIPIRAAWLNFKVVDGAGATVFESGLPQADGRIGGNDNDKDTREYEKHHRVISDPDDVQIYEAVMLDTDDQVTYTLLRAASYVKDNRLLPRGFDKKTASQDIAVYGQAQGDDDFAGGSDLVTYEADIAGHRGPFTVRAELFYRAVAPAFVEDMRVDSDLPEVRRFLKYYDKADKQPVAVAAAEAVSR